MNELEKCMAGEYYNCHDEIFLDFKTKARKLLREYNALAYEQKEEKADILKRLFGKIGTNVSVGAPFICDYGQNIYYRSGKRCDKRYSRKFTCSWESMPYNPGNKHRGKVITKIVEMKSGQKRSHIVGI